MRQLRPKQSAIWPAAGGPEDDYPGWRRGSCFASLLTKRGQDYAAVPEPGSLLRAESQTEIFDMSLRGTTGPFSPPLAFLFQPAHHKLLCRGR